MVRNVLTLRALRQVAATGVIVATMFGSTALAEPADIWTVGGGGIIEFEDGLQYQTGDGGPAVQATFVSPWGVAVGADGTIYVTDVNAHTVRMIRSDRSIDTLAGTTRGFSGDGGPAIGAQLWGPRAVVIDPAGGLIIADTENDRLRKLWPDGSITTIAGGYQQSPGSIGDGGPLREATMAKPYGLAFAPTGELYILEGGRLRRVDLSGTITTVAGGLYYSGGLDVDSYGNVYVAESHALWQFDLLNQKTLVAGRNNATGSVADGIAATDARLDGAGPITLAPNGDIYFADNTQGRIRRISGGVISTVAGGGDEAAATGCRSATRPRMQGAWGLDIAADGSIVISTGNLVRKIALGDLPCPSITPLNPTRILETRVADGQIGYSGPRPNPGQTVVLDAARTGSPVPDNATAVALNLTITGAVNDGYVTAWPCEATQPITSNVNVRAGQTAANAVLVTLGRSNTICLFDQAGGDLIVDVTGYIGVDVPYQALVPYRALETRTTEARWHYYGDKPVAGQTIRVPISGWGVGFNAVSAYASAVVLNVTATDATADGFVTVWSCEAPRPTASSLNVTAGGTVGHLVIAQLGEDPTNTFGISKEVCLFTQSGTHLVVDILGAFMPESTYVALAPDRVLETRAADGQIGYEGARPVAGQVVTIDVPGATGGAVPSTARAVAVNLTATNPGTPGYVTVWPCGADRPLSSSLNLAAGDTQSNAVIVGLGADGKICIFTQGGADLIADLNGFFA